ncbi:MAG: hypothetical protein JWQ98_1116 [Chlorobi bacterium]|nr:hypothetical protein [Chlorobiota bacterium]
MTAIPSQMTIPKKRKRAGGGEPALDHELLFAEGLGYVERLARRLWNDFNFHDPGITTLELLCYAITDLSYRASRPIRDLLAGPGNDIPRLKKQFATARRILPNRSLTQADYRKLMIDVAGVKNAWIAPEPRRCYADTIRGELLRADPHLPGVIPVDLAGFYRVTIEFADDIATDQERAGVVAGVRKRLDANRNLCEDFGAIDEVAVQQFVLCCELEVEPAADLTELHAQVLFQVDEYLSPEVRQYPLSEMMERRMPDGTLYTVDRIFEGPSLCHGFIPDEDLAASELRTEVRLSDIISIIMDIPGVRAVRDIVVNPTGITEALPNKWVIPVAAGRQARLSRDQWRIVSYKRAMPFTPDRVVVLKGWDDLEKRNAKVRNVDDLPIPVGTFRAPDRYYSMQNHYPVVYGISNVGLSDAVGERRKAQADQLKGYLLFFDQIMADYLSQLRNVAELFSYDRSLEMTYFSQVVDSFAGYQRIYRPAPGDIIPAIDLATASGDTHDDRRHRFLDHLISRFAERFHDFVHIMHSEFGTSAAGLAAYKEEFLRTYPAISGRRSLGYDHSLRGEADLWNSRNISGLEMRLATLLGMRNPARRDLSRIAIDVYAEIDATPGDEFRFRLRKRTGGVILLSSSTRYATPDLARAELRAAIHMAMTPAGYQRKVAINGRHYFNIIDEKGEVIARRIEYFNSAGEMNAAIDDLVEYLRAYYSDEGMYLIENILLWSDTPGDRLLPICPDPNCVDCQDEDPYSYRIHIILPAYGARFEDMKFRRWAEGVIREETPAHIMPKICWISRDDMAALEKVYRDWIYLRAGADATNAAARLTAFIEELYAVKSVYPKQSLHECDSTEADSRFILGQTALGTM